MAAYYLAGTAYMIQPVCFVWATQVLMRDGDDAARAIILYSMNGASSVLFAFWGVVLYPASDAATGFHKGTIAMVCIAGLLFIWIGIVWWQDRRSLRMHAASAMMIEGKMEEEIDLENVEPTTKEEVMLATPYLSGPNLAK